MLRRGFLWGAVLAVTLAGLTTAARAEDMRTADEFLRGLRERGYFDLASEFLEELRTNKETPGDIKATIDYEQGRLLLEEAAKTGDLVRKKELLDQARGKIAQFVAQHGKHKAASEAAVQLARLLVERGHLAMLNAEEIDDKEKAEKEAKLKEARTSFDEAREAYSKAEVQLEANFKTFPNFIPAGDPRVEERDKAHNALMDAQLQKAVVDYEQGETYPLGSPERTELLKKSLAQFEELYKKYRTQMSGLAAQMWQAKCYEEMGELNKAAGIYKQLLEHTDPRLRGLQRFVLFFQIITERKREQYALAADDCNRWLQRFNSPAERHSREGLGVLLEKSKNILAQLKTALNEAEKKQMIDAAVESAREVVRYSSPWKKEALGILKQYRPKSPSSVEDVSRLSFDDAMTGADQAIGAKEWDNAIALLKQAVKKANPAKEPDKANLPRYQLAFCYFMNKQFYEAFAICDLLTHRYPNYSMSPKAAEIAMACMADAYNTYVDFDRKADLDGLIATAKFTEERFPDTESGDQARLILGQINDGLGNYPEAIRAYEAVRSKAGSKWVEAQTKVGSSRWSYSQELRQKGGAESIKEADAEVEKALANLKKAMAARQEAGTPATDAALINNACDMFDIYLNTNRTKEALDIIAPSVKAVTAGNTQPYKRVMECQLRGHIAGDQIELALTDMAALEKVGGSAGLVQLYYGLGKLIEKEMEEKKAKGDTAGLGAAQQKFLKFLRAVAAAQGGQTYESLEWAGENMLKLGEPKQAGEIFNKILTELKDVPADKLFRTNLRMVAAYREQREWKEADTLFDKLLAQSPKSIEVLFELGMLKEAKAAANQIKWAEACNQWIHLGRLMQSMRVKPPEYYDSNYHAAYCLYKGGDKEKALQTLKVVMKLSRDLGGPEMRKKYQLLIDQIQRDSRQVTQSAK